MPSAHLVFFLVLHAFLSPVPSHPQQSQNPDASLQLLQSLKALSGSQTLADLTLRSTVRHVSGSTDETGSATLRTTSAGVSRVDLEFSSGQWSEVVDTSSKTPSGSWSGPDSTRHSIPLHNLFIPCAWFSPAFVISGGLSTPGAHVSFVGQETLNEKLVQHFSIVQVFPTGVEDSATFQNLATLDIFVDPISQLPVAITFNRHPDDNLLLNIPVWIYFSDYRTIQNMQIPFRVQEYFNGVLSRDFQIQTVVINAGLTNASIQN